VIRTRTGWLSRLRLGAVLLGTIAVIARGLQDDSAADGTILSPSRSEFPSLAPTRVLKSQVEFFAEPHLLPLKGDRALLCFNGYTLGQGDRIHVVEIEPDRAYDVDTIPGDAASLFRPTAALDASSTAWVFFTQLRHRKAVLAFSRKLDEGWSPPAVLREGEGPALNPSVVLHGTELIVAWQEYVPALTRGVHRILAASVQPEGLGDPVTLSPPFKSALHPQVVSDGQSAWVVWTQFTGADYEIFAREFVPHRERQPSSLNLSQSPGTDDLHPAAALARDGSLYVAWDQVQGIRKGPRASDGGADGDAQIVMRCVRDGKRYELSSSSARTEELESANSIAGGFPALVVDPAGRLQRAARFLYRPVKGAFSFPLRVDSLSGQSFGESCWIRGSDGRLEPPRLCATENGTWVAYQCANQEVETERDMVTPTSMQRNKALVAHGLRLTEGRHSAAIGLLFLPRPVDSAEEIDRVELPAVTDGFKAEPGEHESAERKEPTETARDPVEIDGVSYQLYFGDLHRHSSMSQCSKGFEPDPLDRFDFGRDVHRCDFYALTDHSGRVDEFDCWQWTKLVDLFQTPTFCTLPGYEWSTFRFGHQNVIFRDLPLEVIGPEHFDALDPEGLWKQLEEGRAITIPHHCAEGEFPTDWNYSDPRFLRLVEVFQALRGNYEFSGCFRQARKATVEGSFIQDALNMGHQFGLIASTDHGTGQSFAAVFAKALDRDSIFDALLARRTYGSTVRDLFVDFRIDGAFMGEEVQCSAAPGIDLHARGVGKIAIVDVFRNGELARSFGRVERPVRGDRKFLDLKTLPVGPERSPWTFLLRIDQGRIRATHGLAPTRVRKGTRMEWTRPDERSARLDLELELPVPQGLWSRIILEQAEDATVSIESMGESFSSSVQQLREKPLSATTGSFRWHLRLRRPSESATLELEQGLGVDEFHEQWTDDAAPEGASWYYARIIQEDGEMAWTSPIFVQRDS